MKSIGKKECRGAYPKEIGRLDVAIPSNHFKKHNLLWYFEKYFGFVMDETMIIV